MCNPRPSLGVVVVKISYILTTYPYFHNFQFEILMQVSATLSRLLRLRLGFERFQHISLSPISFTKIKVSHSTCGPH